MRLEAVDFILHSWIKTLVGGYHIANLGLTPVRGVLIEYSIVALAGLLRKTDPYAKAPCRSLPLRSGLLHRYSRQSSFLGILAYEGGPKHGGSVVPKPVQILNNYARSDADHGSQYAVVIECLCQLLHHRPIDFPAEIDA
ncbi:MAG: hypothetical protein Ct9H300mP13_4230 [Gammaproteobacteria bacterium]|nr:MAG: hypothetical protein Ct9H300mP13_4230 [Gammaproteobacteria bacterium]